jgi:hypothetical protein
MLWKPPHTRKRSKINLIKALEREKISNLQKRSKESKVNELLKKEHEFRHS